MAGSILHKLFGAFFKAPAPDEPDDVYESTEAEVRDYATRAVAEGFDDRDALCARVRDCFEDSATPGILTAIPTMVDAAILAHRQSQHQWPLITDCDKLDAAFLALEDEGIVARHHFSCCGTCGVAEIGDEIADVADRGVDVTGYAFYHMQDTEHAVEGSGLYLNYGGVDDDPEHSIAVGHRIAKAVRASGLDIDWDGSLDKRIGVSLDWKRRRVD